MATLIAQTELGSVANVTTPAQFSYDAGALRTHRMAPARFEYSASTTLVTTKDSSVSTSAAVPDLDRLNRFDRLVRGDQVDPRFQVIWQQTMEAIEAAFEALNQRVSDNSAILARLTAAETLAEAANDNARAAQETASAVQAATEQTFTDIDPVLGNSFGERVDLQ